MRSTADRYREAGMPPPKGEVDSLDAQRRLARRAHGFLLSEQVHDPATDEPVLPDGPADAYGPDSVPLGFTDANTIEEQS